MSQFSGDSEAWDPFPLPFPFSVLLCQSLSGESNHMVSMLYFPRLLGFVSLRTPIDTHILMYTACVEMFSGVSF